MIEPQNTMMPLPAEPAPPKVPQGESGFGDMLAQTLGAIPQLDANAIKGIVEQYGGSGEDGADLADDGGTGRSDHLLAARLSRHDGASTAGNTTVSPVAVDRPPFVDTSFANPVYDKTGPAHPELPPGSVPIPQPTELVAAPIATDPPGDDQIGDPILTGQQPQADALPDVSPSTAAGRPEAPAVTEAGLHDPVRPVPVDPDPRPEPPPAAPTRPPVDSGAVPAVPDAPPVDQGPMPVSGRDLPVAPIVAAPAPVRSLPAQPITMADRPAAAKSSLQHLVAETSLTRPASVAPDTKAEPAVRLADAAIELPKDRTMPVSEPAAWIKSSKSGTQGSPAPLMAGEAPAAPTVTATPVTTPAAPVQHSALAERVMQAVELQANQPPPRTMVVDIPEIEGLRLVVSVRSGEVHVVPATASTGTDGIQPFLDELRGVLESRGFVMTGDGRQRGRNPHDEDDPVPPRAPRPTFRRAGRSDNDLRI